MPVPETPAVADDAALLRRLQAGDRSALAELYDQHASGVYAVCLRVLRQPPEAEAVVSDVFLEIWRKPDGFDPSRGGWRTYLLPLARSRSIDRLRASATRQAKTEAAHAEGQSPPPSPDPAELAELGERRGAVRAAVEQLEEEQRSVLMLSYFDGLTHKEIAEALGMPLGTVKTRIRAGLKALRKSLAGRGVRDAL